MSVLHVCSALRGQKRALNPPGLELHVARCRVGHGYQTQVLWKSNHYFYPLSHDSRPTFILFLIHMCRYLEYVLNVCVCSCVCMCAAVHMEIRGTILSVSLHLRRGLCVIHPCIHQVSWPPSCQRGLSLCPSFYCPGIGIKGGRSSARRGKSSGA